METKIFNFHISDLLKIEQIGELSMPQQRYGRDAAILWASESQVYDNDSRDEMTQWIVTKI